MIKYIINIYNIFIKIVNKLLIFEKRNNNFNIF